MHHLGIWGRGIAPLQHPSYQRPQQSRPLIPGISAISRERIVDSPCARLSRTPWVVVTPPTTTGPLPLLWHWRPLRLPCIQGAKGGSGVARTALSPSALGTLPLSFRPANRPGKPILSDK